MCLAHCWNQIRDFQITCIIVPRIRTLRLWPWNYHADEEKENSFGATSRVQNAGTTAPMIWMSLNSFTQWLVIAQYPLLVLIITSFLTIQCCHIKITLYLKAFERGRRKKDFWKWFLQFDIFLAGFWCCTNK